VSDETKGGKRRPQDADLPDLMFHMSEGKSLRKACEELGIDPPSAHHWLEADDDRRQQYARARALRSEFHADKGLEIGYAAASGQMVEINGEEVTIDPNGARVALDAIKWSTARMNPKGEPTKKLAINHLFNGSDEELDAAIDELTEGDIDEAPAEG
jgi:hypothetical protein